MSARFRQGISKKHVIADLLRWRMFGSWVATLRSRYGLLTALLAIDGTVLAVVLDGPSVAYSTTVNELLANPPEWRSSRDVRVEGVIQAGSLAKKRSTCEYRFGSRSDGADGSLDVCYLAPVNADGTCALSDVLCDLPGIELRVMAEGRLERSPSGPLFVAHALSAKCPRKYETSSATRSAATTLRCPPIPSVP